MRDALRFLQLRFARGKLRGSPLGARAGAMQRLANRGNHRATGEKDGHGQQIGWVMDGQAVVGGINRYEARTPERTVDSKPGTRPPNNAARITAG